MLFRSGGLGAFAGTAWRFGLMGHNARERSVTTVLGAIRELQASGEMPGA